MIEYTDLEVETFGKADDNGEIVVDRVALKKDFIERGVRILQEMETLKGDLKELLQETKDRAYDKAEMKKLIEQQYQYTLDEEIEERERLKVELNNLFGE